MWDLGTVKPCLYSSVPVWCVALIRLIVGVDTDVVHRGLAAELDIDEMWLRPVRLPVCVRRPVPQLVNSETCNVVVIGSFSCT